MQIHQMFDTRCGYPDKWRLSHIHMSFTILHRVSGTKK